MAFIDSSPINEMIIMNSRNFKRIVSIYPLLFHLFLIYPFLHVLNTLSKLVLALILMQLQLLKK